MPANTFNYYFLTCFSFIFYSTVIGIKGDYGVNSGHNQIRGTAAQSASPPFYINLTNTMNLVCYVAYKDLQIGCTAEAGDGFNPLEITKVKDAEKGPEKLDQDWCTTYCHFIGCLKVRIPTAAMDCPREDLLRHMIISAEEVFHERCSNREPDGSYSFVCNGSESLKFASFFIVLLFWTIFLFM